MQGERTGAGETGPVKWEDLPSEGDSLLIDVEKVRAQAQQVPERQVKRAAFKAPVDVTEGQLKGLMKKALEWWLEREDKRGWRLESQVALVGPMAYRDPVTELYVPGYHQWVVQGWFRYTRTPKAVKLAINPALVKQDPEHEVRAGGPHKELSELVRGMG